MSNNHPYGNYKAPARASIVEMRIWDLLNLTAGAPYAGHIAADMGRKIKILRIAGKAIPGLIARLETRVKQLEGTQTPKTRGRVSGVIKVLRQVSAELRARVPVVAQDKSETCDVGYRLGD